MLIINSGKKFPFIHLSGGSVLVDYYTLVFVFPVRLCCHPFTPVLNTHVSLWAPGTPGMESRIRQVR